MTQSTESTAAQLKPDSLTKRYFYKVLSNLIGLVSNVLIQAVVPRSLGPKVFGDFNFITNFFSAMIEFVDGRSSIGLLVKSSLRPKDEGLVVSYFYYICLSTLLVLSLVGLAFHFGWAHVVWPEQIQIVILMGLAWALLVWFHTILHYMCDAYGLTVMAEKIRSVQKITSGVLILILYWTQTLNLTTFFVFYYFLFAILILGFWLTLKKAGHWPHRKAWFLPITKLKSYFKEYYQYSMPLFLLISFEALASLIDRWILQTMGGSREQGYFGFAYQLGYISFAFAAAMSPLFQRDFSVAYSEGQVEKMKTLFRKFIPLLFGISAYFSIFIAFQSNNLVHIFGGDEYASARETIVILSFFPIYLSYSHLMSSVFFATSNTKLFRNLGVSVLASGIPLSFFLIAPSENFGLGLGSEGLAIKTFVIKFFLANLQLYFNCKLLGAKFKTYTILQLKCLVAFVIAGALSTFLSHFEVHRVSMRLVQFFSAGCIYTLLVGIFIFLFPGILGLERAELIAHIKKFSEQIKHAMRYKVKKGKGSADND